MTAEAPYSDRDDVVIRSVYEIQNSVVLWFKNKALSSDEVFSAVWRERIQEWSSWLIANRSTQKRGTAIASTSVDDFDIRTLFLAAPGPGFLVWEILQSCYDLDIAICGTNEWALSEIAEWQQLKTFQYLMSETISTRWKEELEKLNDGLRAGTFSQATFEKRLYDILKCVQRLEVARNCWEKEMNASIPYQFLSAIHYRCFMIENSLAALEQTLSKR